MTVLPSELSSERIQFVCLNVPGVEGYRVQDWNAMFKRDGSKNNRALRVVIIDQVRVSEIRWETVGAHYVKAGLRIEAPCLEDLLE